MRASWFNPLWRTPSFLCLQSLSKLFSQNQSPFLCLQSLSKLFSQNKSPFLCLQGLSKRCSQNQSPAAEEGEVSTDVRPRQHHFRRIHYDVRKHRFWFRRDVTGSECYIPCTTFGNISGVTLFLVVFCFSFLFHFVLCSHDHVITALQMYPWFSPHNYSLVQC